MSVDITLKVLIVEDSGITRKMEIKALKSLGYVNIIEAVDGDEATEKLLSENDVELIISDWNMPNMSGYDLLKWVRSNDTCKNIPFIMATAQGEKKQTIAATEAGVSNFITKPFGPPELQKAINDTFTKPESGSEPEEAPDTGPQIGVTGKPLIRAAHIQITDHLTLGVAKSLIETEAYTPKHFELETICMPSWNPVQEALEKGTIDAAFILAPIAMDLFNYNVPIKLVLFAHKNGSISVRRKNAIKSTLAGSLKGKTFFIPHIQSIHHMLSTMFLREIGLKPGLTGEQDVDTFFEVVPPARMPELLTAQEDSCGFTVAEPLGTKAIASGNAELLFLSGELWEYHPCCVVVFRKEFIDRRHEALQEFIGLLIESGQYITKNPEKAAQIGVEFLDPEKKLGLNVPVLKNVLKEPQGIKTDDLYPVQDDLDRIQRYMVQEMGIGSIIDLDAFIDTRFADAVYENMNIMRRPSRMNDLSKIVHDLAGGEKVGVATKANLDIEGKYLFFGINKELFGINVLSVMEIIKMMAIKSIPRTPDFVKGVINLRGKVIPIIDLRICFGYEDNGYDDNTCIIVIEKKVEDCTVSIGIIVERVSEVMTITASDVEETPSFGIKTDLSFIKAMAKVNGKIRSLLNVDRIFTEHETEVLINMD